MPAARPAGDTTRPSVTTSTPMAASCVRPYVAQCATQFHRPAQLGSSLVLAWCWVCTQWSPIWWPAARAMLTAAKVSIIGSALLRPGQRVAVDLLGGLRHGAQLG